MTILDWNKDSVAQQELDAFLKTKTGQDLISVLESRMHRVPRGIPIDQVTANMELGRVNGYMDCLGLLQLMRKEIETPNSEPLTPDWGTAEEVIQ